MKMVKRMEIHLTRQQKATFTPEQLAEVKRWNKRMRKKAERINRRRGSR